MSTSKVTYRRAGKSSPARVARSLRSRVRNTFQRQARTGWRRRSILSSLMIPDAEPCRGLRPCRPLLPRAVLVAAPSFEHESTLRRRARMRRRESMIDGVRPRGWRAATTAAHRRETRGASTAGDALRARPLAVRSRRAIDVPDAPQLAHPPSQLAQARPRLRRTEMLPFDFRDSRGETVAGRSVRIRRLGLRSTASRRPAMRAPRARSATRRTGIGPDRTTVLEVPKRVHARTCQRRVAGSLRTQGSE